MIHAPENLRIPGRVRGRHAGPITRAAFGAEVRARYTWAWAEHRKWVALQKEAGTYIGLMDSGYATNGFARDVDDQDEEWAHLPAAEKETT
jgi:hypothetical protein